VSVAKNSWEPDTSKKEEKESYFISVQPKEKQQFANKEGKV